MDENKNLEQQMSTLRVGLNNQMNEKKAARDLHYIHISDNRIM
jgi:hypothetical protein